MQLLYNYPQIYDYNLPTGFSHDNFNLSQAVQGKHVGKPPWNHYEALLSEGGQQFASFAKYSSYGQGNLLNRLLFSVYVSEPHS
jgi:Deoxyribonuclease II